MIQRYSLVARSLFSAVALVGLLVLIGWVLDIRWLKSPVPHGVSMKANTALGLLLLGLAGASWTPAFRKPLALLGALIGVLTLWQYVGNSDLRIDELLFSDPPSPGDRLKPGRMAPVTALNFVFLGASLVLSQIPAPRRFWASQCLALLALGLGIIAALGYPLSDSPNDLPLLFFGVAAHTGVCLTALAIGVMLSQARHGFMRILALSGEGSSALRRLLPVLILVPILLGWLGVHGEHLDLYAKDTTHAILVVPLTFVMLFSVWKLARSLNRTYFELQKSRTSLENRVTERTRQLITLNESLTQSEERTRAILTHSSNAIVETDSRGIITGWNSQAERIFGFRNSEARGLVFADLFSTPGRQTLKPELFLQPQRRMELIAFHKEGREIPVEFSMTQVNLKDEVFYVAFMSDISVRKEQEMKLQDNMQELASANQQLERSNQALEEFADIASHDLKEPLRGIARSSEMIIADLGEDLNPTVRSHLITIQKLSGRFGVVIEALLNFSRVGKTEAAIQAVELHQVVEEVIDSLDFPIREKRASIRVPEKLPTCTCDPYRVTELFRNLITNAIKYNDKSEPVVEIGSSSVVRNGHATRAYYVRDNGIGIEPRNFEEIFQMFKRLHGREQFGGGTGLGLALVKKIVDRHGGEIWVESVPQAGTTFWFTLPEPKAAPIPAAHAA